MTAGPQKISVELDVTSEAPAEEVRALLDVAHRSCFVENAIRRPHRIVIEDRLNGDPLKPAAG